MSARVPETYREEFATLTLDELAERLAEHEPNTVKWQAAMAEFTRRGAVAANETADATQRNARYMLWSVVVLTIASIANVIVTIASRGHS
jgi:hypothetical protein